MLARLTAHPQVLKVILLYGLLSRGEEKLIPKWLMQEQRLAPVHVDQLTGLVCKYQVGWLTMYTLLLPVRALAYSWTDSMLH